MGPQPKGTVRDLLAENERGSRLHFSGPSVECETQATAEIAESNAVRNACDQAKVRQTYRTLT